jgi:hypothetical protein
LNQPDHRRTRAAQLTDRVVRAACWACGAVLEKSLRGGRRLPQRLNWHCRGCDVSWSGPAELPYA